MSGWNYRNYNHDVSEEDWKSLRCPLNIFICAQKTPHVERHVGDKKNNTNLILG